MTFFDKMQSYRTPEGKIDIPYVYLFDATGLTDGQSYQYLNVLMDHNSDFILRAVRGMNLCLNQTTGKFLLRYDIRTVAECLTSASQRWRCSRPLS